MSSYMAAAATCLLIALVGRIGLRLASDGEDMISWGRGLLPALIGGMPIAFLLPGSLEAATDPLIYLSLVGLGAALGVGAIIDRETGWGPDALMIVLAAGSMVLGTMIAGWPLTPLQAALLGLVILLGINLVWLALVKLTGYPFITPPADILAFALPLMIFGLSTSVVAIMLYIAVASLLCMCFPAVAAVFTNPAATQNVLRKSEMNDTTEAQGLTLLSVALPATWAAILVWLI